MPSGVLTKKPNDPGLMPVNLPQLTVVPHSSSKPTPVALTPVAPHVRLTALSEAAGAPLPARASSRNRVKCCRLLSASTDQTPISTSDAYEYARLGVTGPTVRAALHTPTSCCSLVRGAAPCSPTAAPKML